MKGKRMFGRTVVLLLVLLLAGIQAIPSAVAAEDEDVTVSTVRLHTFGTSDAIPGTVSTLVRRAGGVSLSVDTLGLNPGEVYTIWWVIFNNPAACSEGGCVGADLSNPETEATVGYATGEIADENGMATFRAVLAVGDNSFALDNDAGFPFELVLPSPGLSDPYGAEIHAVLRTHGAALDDPSGQLGSFNDGCNPECFNEQAALHYPDDSWSLDEDDENIVVAVVSAPVDANGIMAGEPSGLNIFLSARGTDAVHFGDPRHFGHQIPAGGWMEIELGGTFERNGLDNDAEFVEMDGNSYLIMLAGLPQNPIVAAAGEGAQHGNYTVSDDGTHTIIVTPNGGEGANGVEGSRANEVGIKTLHILPKLGSATGPAAFTNGPADTEGTVAVRIYDADGELVESGHGSVTFPASPGRQVAGVNFGFGTPGNPFMPDTVEPENITGSNYQVVAPGTQMVNTQRGESFAAGAPYALRFMIFEAQELQPDSFGPFMGIPGVGLVVDEEDASTAWLVQDSNEDGVLDDTDESIGSVSITGPDGVPAGSILSPEGWPLTTSGDGVEGANGSFLNVPVQVGDMLGYYEVTVSLDGGGSATLFVVVDVPHRAEKIAVAMTGGPYGIAKDSTVLDWPVAGADPVVLREGTNGWVCRPDHPATPTNDPRCFDPNWRKLFPTAHGPEREALNLIGFGYMLQWGDAASHDDYNADEPPADGDWVLDGPHLMINISGHHDESYMVGPEDGGPYVMFHGFSQEHLMIPAPIDQVVPSVNPIYDAMSAAPLRVSEDAAVMDWPSEASGGEFVVLREGTNGWTCMVDDPSTPTHDPMCVDENFMEFLNALIEGREPEYAGVGMGYMLRGGSGASNEDYTLMAPPDGHDWLIDGPHVMFVVPWDLDPALYSTDPMSGGPYIMWEGTPYEHIMAPVVVK